MKEDVKQEFRVSLYVRTRGCQINMRRADFLGKYKNKLLLLKLLHKNMDIQWHYIQRWAL